MQLKPSFLKWLIAGSWLCLVSETLQGQSMAGTYRIRSLATGKVLTADESRIPASVADGNGTTFQNWTLLSSDVKVQGRTVYAIRNGATGKCLEGAQNKISVYSCNGTDAQKWQIETSDVTDYYLLTCLASGKVLDANEHEVYPMQKNGGNYQKWHLSNINRQATVITAPDATEKRIKKDSYMMLQKGAYSPNKRYQLALQQDGNLVLNSYVNGERKVIWATNTANRQVKYGIFQVDGNFVLYDVNDKAVWASGTDGRGEYLSMQNDGNLVIYDTNGRAVWSTDTWER